MLCLEILKLIRERERNRLRYRSDNFGNSNANGYVHESTSHSWKLAFSNNLGIIDLHNNHQANPMSKNIHFEQSIADLEQIVKELEKGELSLEDSLKQFEKGIKLSRLCQEVLQQAEQKVEMLTAQDMQMQNTEGDAVSD